jgi:uncharacterized membrane protein
MNNDILIPAVHQRPVFKIKDSSYYQSYDLLANYSDPFNADNESNELKSSYDSLTNSSRNNLVNASEQSGEKNIIKPSLSFVQYKGTIINAITHKIAAILSINGKDEFVQVKSKLSNIRIIDIKRDKVLIDYLGEKFWIK